VQFYVLYAKTVQHETRPARTSAAGKPPDAVRLLNMSTKVSIGIDVGGTKTRLALFDAKLAVLEDIKFSTPNRREQFSSTLKKSVRKLVYQAAAGNRKIGFVGIGVAGSVNGRRGTVKTAPNIPFLAGFSFRKALRPVCRCEIVLLNDLHAALYGELKVGKARGYKDVIAIFIGTSIGGAVAIDGKLHLGASGEAGNIGHYLLHAFGPLAGSERHGILDDFASRLAIAGTAATFAAKNWAPHLLESKGTDVSNIKSSAFAEAIRAGDTAIEELVRSRVQIVGIVLSNMVDFLSPQMIVLGGGLTDAMPKIVREEVTRGIHAHSSPAALRRLRVVTTKHKGDAVTIGAARFAMDSIMKGRRYTRTVTHFKP
jgi:glucokinase